ncbi:hypothetical protein ACTFIT_009886 [Dictyostelium discoideum]
MFIEIKNMKIFIIVIIMNDKHIVNGRGEEIAFVHEIPSKQISTQITYKQLFDKVCDIVIIYMQNSIKLIISTLSCCRIGATHNIIFGGYTQKGLSYLLNIYSPTPTPTIIIKLVLIYKQPYLNEYEGYFRTKDIGYYENNLWYFCSRYDDSFSYDSYIVNGGVLENLILKIQNIFESCVIGIDDEIHGKEIAAILLKDYKSYIIPTTLQDVSDIDELLFEYSKFKNLNNL